MSTSRILRFVFIWCLILGCTFLPVTLFVIHYMPVAYHKINASGIAVVAVATIAASFAFRLLSCTWQSLHQKYQYKPEDITYHEHIYRPLSTRVRQACMQGLRFALFP